MSLAAAISGCWTDTTIIYWGDLYPDAGAESDAGDGGTDGGTDGGNNFACHGQCIPFRPLGWSDPILVWSGSGAPPECPAEAPQKQFTMHLDLMAFSDCQCACKPSTGSCTLPTTITAQSAVCYTPGAVETSFNPPTNWDGTCTNNAAIAAGKLCGGTPCVQLITVGAMGKIDDGCEVDPVAVPNFTFSAPTWGSTVIGCEGYPEGGEGGCGSGAKCAPSPAPPPKFRVCVYKEEDVPCSGEFYTERTVIYGGYEDTRDCTPCGCSPEVTGSVCTATASIYTDGTCGAPIVAGYMISSEKDVCLDLSLPGQSLGSKSVANVKYNPGTCQTTGGEPVGSVLPIRPSTICCLPTQ